jgi:hypothetical protein
MCFEFMAPIFVMACHKYFVCHEVFEVINSHACVCVLNNILLICNYDYNINNYFEKGDTYLLDFLAI